MNDHAAAFTAMPERLSALLHGRDDAKIDAKLAELEHDCDLFAELQGDALSEARYLGRIQLFAEELHCLVDEADGTAAAYRERQTAAEEECPFNRPDNQYRGAAARARQKLEDFVNRPRTRKALADA